MKSFSASCVALFAAFSAFAVPVIDDVIVRQQWPWSTDIKVEYKITGVTAPGNITVKVFVGEDEIDVPDFDNAVTGPRYGISEDTVGSLVIDPVKIFGPEKREIGKLTVQLGFEEIADAEVAWLNDEIYRIYCLTNGGCVSVTRRDLLNRKYGSVETDFARIGEGFSTTLEDVIIWTGVTNNIDYKTTHLVMRKIPAAGVTWLSGDDSANLHGRLPLNNRYYVQLTQDYFIGVFELTQYQYEEIYGSNPSENKAGEEAPYRPAELIYRYLIHGNHNPDPAASKMGVLTGEPICWPTNSYLHDVGRDTACHKLRKKTGVEFDLPMSAQWEFACRAGTTGPLYSGKAQTLANLGQLSWHEQNSGGSTHVVGGKLPNAFGLYDMLGNVSEFVHDASSPFKGGTGTGTSERDPMIDPLGYADGVAIYNNNPNRQVRGGSWIDTDGYWRDHRAGAACTFYGWAHNRNFIGARLVCPVEAQWGEHPEGK